MAAYDMNHVKRVAGKYKYNDCDVCLNPEREQIVVQKGAYGYSASITYAMCDGGIWAFGFDYNCGTGGGSSGVSWADKADTKVWNKGFESERECKKFAWRYLLTRVLPQKERNKMVEKLYEAIEKKVKEYSQPKVVQLELFG